MNIPEVVFWPHQFAWCHGCKQHLKFSSFLCSRDQRNQYRHTDFDGGLHYPSDTLLAKGESRLRGLILEANFIS